MNVPKKAVLLEDSELYMEEQKYQNAFWDTFYAHLHLIALYIIQPEGKKLNKESINRESKNKKVS
jgi:hypothetical protein